MVNTRVAQVSNVSAAATMEQLRTLFGFLGKIEDIRLFPKEDSVLPVTVRICFVRFQDPTSVGMAQHLSNTVFLDKALNVTPFPDGVIPEESRALQMVAASAGGLVSMISNAGTSLLPTPPQPLLGHLPGTISGVAVSTTSAGVMDQTFAALGVPQPPPLTNVDPTKVEEIRRTVYVGNLDSGTVTAEQLLNFFQKVGEVKYVRMAGDETQPTRFAFVEFTEQGSVAKALTYNSVMFAGRPLKINHSNNAIVKPPGKTQEAIQKELAETMKQVRDAQALIQAAIDPEIKAAADKNCTEDLEVGHVKGLVGDTEKKKRSKSRSPARRKSRSRSRRRSRSRSKEARRSRSRRSTSRTRRRSRSPRRRSPPPRRKSRSRSRHRRSRSKSKEHRSRSREKRRRSKTPPKSYRASRRSRSRSREKKEESSSKSRRRSRSPSKHRSRSKSRSGSPKRPSKHRKDKKRDRSKDRDRKEKEGRNSSSSSSSRKRKEKEQTEKEPVEAVEEKKEEKTDKADSKIKRDYDEEEKGFDSQEAAPVVKEEKEEEEEEEEPEEEEEEEEVDIVKTEDMDVDSD